MAIGVPYELFWHLNPRKIKPFAEAYKIKQENADIEAWRQHIYTHRAVATAIANALGGNAKFFEKPLGYKTEEKKQLSEEEKKQAQEVLLASLMIAQNKFENSKKAKEHQV